MKVILKPMLNLNVEAAWTLPFSGASDSYVLYCRILLTTSPLFDLLTVIDREVRTHRNLKRVLEALDDSKPEIFSYLCEHLDSDTSAQAITLKIQNLCLAKYHYRAQSAVVLSRPFGLIVDPCNFCNLKCPGCVHSPTAKPQVRWQTGSLDYEGFAKFMEHYGAYATHITMCNWGEPLLNPRTPDFVRLAKRYLIRTMMSTNLSVGQVDAEAYVASGLDFLILSIDGATQLGYQQFRRNGNLELVYRNIRKLVAARQRLDKQTPIICWQFLVFEHNQDEAEAAMQIARELGVDMFKLVQPFEVSWDAPEIRAARVEGRFEVFRQDIGVIFGQNLNPFANELAAEPFAREFSSRWIDRLSKESTVEPDQPSAQTCRWLYTNMAMDANRRIAPCCGTPMQNFDLDFGQFEGREEVFNSEKYRYSRKHFAHIPQATAESTPHCVNCWWDKDSPNIGPAHIDQYLFDIPGIDAASRALLSE